MLQVFGSSKETEMLWAIKPLYGFRCTDIKSVRAIGYKHDFLYFKESKKAVKHASKSRYLNILLVDL